MPLLLRERSLLGPTYMKRWDSMTERAARLSPRVADDGMLLFATSKQGQVAIISGLCCVTQTLRLRSAICQPTRKTLEAEVFT
jgi:hypothetical protein